MHNAQVWDLSDACAQLGTANITAVVVVPPFLLQERSNAQPASEPLQYGVVNDTHGGQVGTTAGFAQPHT